MQGEKKGSQWRGLRSNKIVSSPGPLMKRRNCCLNIDQSLMKLQPEWKCHKVVHYILKNRYYNPKLIQVSTDLPIYYKSTFYCRVSASVERVRNVASEKGDLQDLKWQYICKQTTKQTKDSSRTVGIFQHVSTEHFVWCSLLC